MLGLVSQSFVADGRCSPRDVAPCLTLTARLQAAGLEAPQEPVARHALETRAAARPTPEMRLRSARLRHQVAAWVEAVRAALFGPATPPFPSLAEAVAWLEREVRGLYEGIEPRALALYAPVWGQALGAPPAGDPGSGEPSQRLAALLEAVRAGTIMVVAPADPREPPDQLWDTITRGLVFQLQRQARAIARATGFPEPDVAAYLLAGIQPELSPATIAIEEMVVPLPVGGGEIRRSQVTMVLHARDLSFDKHRELFRQQRHALNLVQARGLTAEDVEFLELVEAQGPPPVGRGAGPYWAGVQREWNARGLGTFYATPDGPRMRYGRLQKKLKGSGLEASPGG